MKDTKPYTCNNQIEQGHKDCVSVEKQFDTCEVCNKIWEEKIIIEHTWKHHNEKILFLITENSIYLDIDAPKEVTQELLEHIIQWNAVYQMKYVDKTYNGPVFSGIAKYGYRGFPKGKDVYYNSETDNSGIDGYFKDKTSKLRESLYEQIRDSIQDINT